MGEVCVCGGGGGVRGGGGVLVTVELISLSIFTLAKDLQSDTLPTTL